jgi:hypothetical protein
MIVLKHKGFKNGTPRVGGPAFGEPAATRRTFCKQVDREARGEPSDVAEVCLKQENVFTFQPFPTPTSQLFNGFQ